MGPELISVPSEAKKAVLNRAPAFIRFVNDIKGHQVKLSDFEILQPWAIAALAAISRNEYEQRSFIVHDPASPTSRFAYSLGLLDIIDGKISHGLPEKGRTVKLNRVNNFADIEKISYDISKLIIENTPKEKINDEYIDPEEIRRTISYVMVELLRNVLQHSADRWGAILLAQSMDSGIEYADEPCIQIAVADLGIGIYESLKRTRPDIPNVKVALERSIWPYYSGAFYDFQKGSSQNAGLGLFFISEMAKLTGGNLMISSKEATLIIKGDKESGGHNQIEFFDVGFPGTLVVFEIPKRGLADHDQIIKMITTRAEERLPGKVHRQIISFDTPVSGSFEFLVKIAAEDTTKAEEFARNHLLPRIKQKKSITFNFVNISVCTQSFIHALLFDVVRLAKEEDVQLFASNYTDAIKDGIKLLEMYALRE